MVGDSLPKYLSGRWEAIKNDIRVYRYETKTPPSSEQSSPTGHPNQKLTIPSLTKNENGSPAKEVTPINILKENGEKDTMFSSMKINNLDLKEISSVSENQISISITSTAPPVGSGGLLPPESSGDPGASSVKTDKLCKHSAVDKHSADAGLPETVPRANSMSAPTSMEVSPLPGSINECDGSKSNDILDFSAVSKSLKASWSGDVSDSVFPIVTAFSKGLPVQILIDNCNDSTLITRNLVSRLGLKVYRGKATTIAGVGDILNFKTSSYANLKINIDENCYDIQGAIIENICSDIRMENFTSLQKYKDMKFSMDFGGASAKNFRIDVLLGLDVLASLVSGNKLDKNGNAPILARRMENMICLEISKNKFLPFGTHPMSSHSGMSLCQPRIPPVEELW
mgnify:CR=1 FL=1